jgi:predicted ATPase
LTQEALAERSGLSAPSISNIERGVAHAPRTETIRLLAEALGVPDEDRAAFSAAAHASAAHHVAPHEAATRGTLSTLPLPATSLLGRERELGEIADALSAAPDENSGGRLLTLSGAGGVGKTHLALVAAHQAQDSFADGACFVSLGVVRDPELVPATIVAALGLHDTSGASGASFTDLLLTRLRGTHLLLLLDNCEHVQAVVTPLVADLLATCAQLRVLATSRVPLRLRGEREYVVQPLALPSHDDLLSVAALEQVAVVRLFVTRVRQVRGGFGLSVSNAAAVAAVCQRLDGLPLAIELAAARCRLLEPWALLERLDARLPLLAGGAQDLPARQRTLRATLRWSYDLLPPEAQAAFRRLAVFAGGFTLEAAEAVCQAAEADARQRTVRTGADGDSAEATPEGVFDAISLLAEQHLLARAAAAPPSADHPDMPKDASGRAAQFTMLETVREYAWERLAAHDETGAAQQAHLEYYLALAEAAAPHLRDAEQARWLARLDAERDNLRVALRHSIETVDAARGLRVANALLWYWYSRSAAREGRDWLERLLALDAGQEHNTAPRDVRALALNSAGIFAYEHGDYVGATTHYEASLALRRADGHRAGVAVTLCNLGIIAAQRDEYARAAALYEESVAILREEGPPGSLARTLNGLGVVAGWQGRYDLACSCHEESLAIKREAGDQLGCAVSLHNLGELAYQQGNLARAEALCQESLALLRSLGATVECANIVATLGLIALAQGALSRASESLEESLRLRREVDDAAGSAETLASLGDLALARGETRMAAQRFGEALARYQESGQRLGIAACLEGAAQVACARQRMTQAVHLVSAATALRQDIGAPIPRAQQARLEEVTTQTRAALDPDQFARAWTAGAALTWKQAGDLVSQVGEVICELQHATPEEANVRPETRLTLP